MAYVEMEGDFTRLPNEVLEALYRAELPGRHLRVFLMVARLTFGFTEKNTGRYKESDPIAASRIEKGVFRDDDGSCVIPGTGIVRQNVALILRAGPKT